LTKSELQVEYTSEENASEFELLHFVDLNELTTGPKGKH